MFRLALKTIMTEAELDGRASVRVNAGDLHIRVGGYPGTNHAMPTCCDVMREAMMSGDRIIDQPPKGRGKEAHDRVRTPSPGYGDPTTVIPPTDVHNAEQSHQRSDHRPHAQFRCRGRRP